MGKEMRQREGRRHYKDTDVGEHIVYKENTSRSILLGDAQFKTNQFVLKMFGDRIRLGTSCIPYLGVQILFYRIIVSEIFGFTQGLLILSVNTILSPSPVVPHKFFLYLFNILPSCEQRLQHVKSLETATEVMTFHVLAAV